jgi:uncharacterized membrane protein
MNMCRYILGSAVAALLTLGVGSDALARAGMEKCAGIVKAGMNDCGTAKTSCAGTSTKDNDAEMWIYVPEGTCEKITGGRVIAPAKKAKAMEKM